jgi:hypothetical protein
MRILHGNVDYDDFGARILNLAKDWIGGPGRKTDVAKYGAGQLGRLRAALQLR